MKSRFLLLLPALLGFTHALQAQSTAVYWTGRGDGASWHDAGNWNTGRLPGTTDSVYITQAAQVTLSEETTILHLVLGGSRRITTLTLDGDLTLRRGGTITNTGLVHWQGGQLQGRGLTNRGLIEIAGSAPKTMQASTLQNEGTVRFAGSGDVFLNNGSVIENAGIIDFQSETNIRSSGSRPGSIRNTAQGTLSGRAAAHIQVELTNAGRILNDRIQADQASNQNDNRGDPTSPGDDSNAQTNSDASSNNNDDTISDHFSSASMKAANGYTQVEVFYGTDRKRTGSEEPTTFYSGERGTLEWGSLKVSIPKQHRSGMLEEPTIWKFEFAEKPQDHVVLLEVQPYSKALALSKLNYYVNASEEKTVMVFVHGYNVSFANAARRTAQVAYDLMFPGIPVMYSWPSDASTASYTADENDIEWTTPHLHQFLTDLRAESGATSIHLIAHSMGNRALTKALKSFTPADKPLFNQVALIAPDIDAAIFKRDLVPALIPRVERITLYASSQDIALAASNKVHGGYPRAGESGDGLVIVDGVDTIDASNLDTDFLGHSYFAQSTPVIDDLFKLLRTGNSPELRRLIKRIKDGLAYWALPG